MNNSPAHRFRVIVAEDEKLIAKNIASHISKANELFEVICIASDGQEAYELTEKLLPDVIFSDIKMPVMDGLELISRINSNFPSVKSVIISGYDDFDYARTAMQQNVFDYLLKPINPGDLKNTLNNLERELLAEKKEMSSNRHSKSIDIAESVKAYLRHNYSSRVCFADIASQYGFSSAYLSKIFKIHNGISPGKYLKEFRINTAKKLLVGSDLSISEIAAKVGFDDQFHFSKSFKSLTGMSPRKFRENDRFTG